MKPKIELEKLKTRLDVALSVMTRKISLLDVIRARPDKKATAEETNELEQLNINFLEPSMISLMLEAKASQRAKKGIGLYKPFLIQMDDISALEFQYKISELVAKKEPFHYDCILMSNLHCSPR